VDNIELLQKIHRLLDKMIASAVDDKAYCYSFAKQYLQFQEGRLWALKVFRTTLQHMNIREG
jgi:hypothetical protein